MEKVKSRSEIENIYKWDINSFIKDENEFNEKCSKIEELTNELVNFKGKILQDEDTLETYMSMSEELDKLTEDIYVYAHMLCDSNTKDTESQKQKMKSEKIEEIISEKLSFIGPEILKSDLDTILEMINKKENLKKYKFYFEELFRYKKYTLDEKSEELITKAENAMGTGSEVFYNLDNSDISLGTIKTELGDVVELTNSNYIKYVKSQNIEVRKEAFQTLYKYYKNHKNTLAASLKGNIKENFFISNIRGYKNPLEMSLYGDDINRKVYDNLIKTVHENNDKMYDYMKIRKKMLNLKEMHMYDIYVDLVEDLNEDIPYEEGKNIVLEALKPLGEQYIEDLTKAFEERWIDIYPSDGKKSGAYSWGTYNSKPFVLLNYTNDIEDVSTLAHELGHSMHSYYSKTNDYIYSNYPIFLAEIASTVNEMLLNHYLYKNAKDNKTKIYYLTDFLDKVRTTLYRQTMFAEFELIMHDKEEQQIPLTEEEFSSTYYELNKKYYGNEVINDEEIKYEWARIPHFYTSFYVYKYATGISAALAITSDILNGNEKTKEAYLEFLKSGSTNYPLETLKKVGVDMTTSEPVQKALNMFGEKLEELKKLIEQ